MLSLGLQRQAHCADSECADRRRSRLHPQLTGSLWTALLAPAATPSPIIQKLNTALNESLKTPEVQKAYANLDVVTRIVTPQELKTFIAEDVRKWRAQVVPAQRPGSRVNERFSWPCAATTRAGILRRQQTIHRHHAGQSHGRGRILGVAQASSLESRAIHA